MASSGSQPSRVVATGTMEGATLGRKAENGYGRANHRRRPSLLVPLTGPTFGALVSLVNAATHPVAHVLSLVIGVGWSWAALGVVVGWWAATNGSRRRVAAVATVSLVGAVVAYYAVDLARGVYATTDPSLGTPLALALSDLRLWAVAALVTGPALGLVGATIRRPDRWGLACSLVVPAGAAAEMALLLALDSRATPLTVATRGVVGALAVTAAVALLRRWAAGCPAARAPRPA
jgi:hypothetical protein